MPKDGPIYGKFYVTRVDGRDRPGGDKANAQYYVLDYANDPFAREALMYYAFKCADEFPQLANDIWNRLKVDIDSMECTQEQKIIKAET
jgi:hypothetical protein